GHAFERTIAPLLRDTQGTPADLDRLTMVTDNIPESRANVGKHETQAGAVADAGCHAFGFAHEVQCSFVLLERDEGDAEIELDVDDPNEDFTAFGKPPECLERPLERFCRPLISRTCQCSVSGLPEISGGLIPGLGRQSVTRQTLDIVGQPLSRTALQGFENPEVKGSPPL